MSGKVWLDLAFLGEDVLVGLIPSKISRGASEIGVVALPGRLESRSVYRAG